MMQHNTLGTNAARLRYLRLHHNYTRSTLADILYVSPSAYGKLERNGCRDVEKLRKLSAFYNMDLAELLPGQATEEFPLLLNKSLVEEEVSEYHLKGKVFLLENELLRKQIELLESRLSEIQAQCEKKDQQIAHLQQMNIFLKTRLEAL